MYPLEGVRVLDLSRALSGPYVGRLLADLGAEVVKVEVPGTDITQVFGPRSHGHTGLYVQANTGKRNISVDLATDAGAALLRELAGRADVVIENFRPGTLDRLGVGWEQLSAANPKLVLLSISGFGQWGPEAGRQAYAPVLHAESGLLGRQAQVDGGEPHDLVMALADSIAGLHGTIGILAALRLAESSGVGQHVDISMLEAMLATDDYTHYSLEGTQEQMSVARGTIYPATGGPIMIAADPKFLWHRLSAAHGLADADPAAPAPARIAARSERMRAWVAGFTDRAALVAALQGMGVAWADVRNPDTIAESPSVAAREVALQVDDRHGGTRPVVRMPYRFSAGDCGPRAGAAYVGEHNAEVLRDWLGLADDRIAGLAEQGALLPSTRPDDDAELQRNSR
jgi:CoA:oxalate CoA-transferase